MFEKPKNKKFLLVIFFILILAIIFHYIGILRPIENLAVLVSRPVQGVFYNFTTQIREYHNRWNNYHEMTSEIDELEDQLKEALIDRSALKILQEENEFLRQQVDFIRENQAQVVISNVIGINDDGHSKNLIINRGLKNGIFIGAPVLVDNIIVGKVIKTENSFSIVRMINDQFSQLAVTVMNNSKTIGLVKGEYGLGAKMDMIPQHEEINVGDIIITSGLEDNIPYGLVVGTVETIDEADEAIFKTATINLPVNFDKIFMVSILTSQQYDD